MLFVTTYFQALIDHVLTKKIELKKETKILDMYFENFEVNEKLLELTDEILDQFFDQTVHIRQDDDDRDIITLHNFFNKSRMEFRIQENFKKYHETEKR